MKIKRTHLQETLFQVAPLIRIRTIWEKDTGGEREWKELSKAGNCFEGAKRSEWACWQSEVEALAIIDFERVTGSAYLAGTWEKKGDKPDISNPDISGYENQMTVEALEELEKRVSKAESARLGIEQALEKCRELNA